MRPIQSTLFAAAIALPLLLPTAYATDKGASHERRYCTQYGPFFIRFDPDKAAGVFAILSNNDLGSIVGSLNDHRLEGEWIEVDSRGDIRITFTDDWSSFEAEYNVAAAPDRWHGDWTGHLPANAESDSFEIDGVTYRCR